MVSKVSRDLGSHDMQAGHQFSYTSSISHEAWTLNLEPKTLNPKPHGQQAPKESRCEQHGSNLKSVDASKSTLSFLGFKVWC